MNVINVCLACDNNYAKYAGVVIASILANAASEDCLHFFILDGGIKKENKEKIISLTVLHECKIEFIEIDESLFDDYKNIKTHAYITLPTYYRLKITSLLPETDRIIYLDCDVAVNTSLSELFFTEMGNNPIAGVHDINSRRVRKNPTYINAGVLVMDLKNMRRLDVENEFLAYARNNMNSISCGDQEIINEVCKNKICISDARWNVQSSNFVNRSSYTSDPYIIHFVARQKPWHWASFSVHKDLYFKYLQLTPWKLSEEDLYRWTVKNKWASRLAYLKYRPFFWLRPRFYKACYFSLKGKH